MGQTVRRVLILLPLLLSCGAGSSALVPPQDSAADASTDVPAAPDTVDELVGTETLPPEDLPALPECLTDDDCQGLAIAIPLCRIVICDEGLCAQVDAVDGVPCHSGAACKDPGTCAKGSCVELPASCDDGDPCTGETCESGVGCLYEPLSDVPCEDADLCTATEHCVYAASVGAAAVDCDDGVPCTLDLCDPWFGCLHEDLDALCDDGDPCTGGDQCIYGTCVGTTDVCECDTDADCAGYTNACFSAYTCDADAVPRVCLPAPETEAPCPDVGPCLAGSCNPATEACDPIPKPDGTPCADAQACVADGECVAGTCVGAPVACEGGGECTVPACVPGEGCVEVPAPGPCDDGDPCSVNDWCVDGACAGVETACGAAAPALFRVTKLAWEGPALTFLASGVVEVALDEAMDVALAQSLVDSYAPLDLLLGLAPLDTKGPSALQLGTVACLRDAFGVVTSCPWPASGAALDGVEYCLDGDPCEALSAASPAPAFGVLGGVSGPLTLGAGLGGSIEPAAAAVVGQLEGLPAPTGIASGTLSLFLGAEAAEVVTMAPPLMAPMALSDLLDPGALSDVDGLAGWWLHLDFEAVRIPIIP